MLRVPARGVDCGLDVVIVFGMEHGYLSRIQMLTDTIPLESPLTKIPGTSHDSHSNMRHARNQTTSFLHVSK